MSKGPLVAPAAVVALLAFFACGGRTANIGGDGGTGSSSGSGSSSGAFPFTGPSCTSAQINTGCWQCTVDNCNGACVTADCAAFFQCFCACPAGDTGCQNSCTGDLTSTCQTCLNGIDNCNSGTCKSSCPVTTTACSGSQCSSGTNSIELCTVSSGGTCTAAYYQVGSQQFACASCTDTSSCEMAAQMACH
ncbi:MAG TPA: hypothetical protein VMI75_23250 [Polyangiaceae bacterium]|nr:hypothetical protein [Polyangiaceae bacterium]